MPGAHVLPGGAGRRAGDPVSDPITAAQIARLLGLPEPTPEQVTVIEAPLEPMLVVAGAGSGKTETMAARVVWLVANELVRAEEVLGLTFTRKAAGELAERIGLRLRRLSRALGTPRDGIGDDRPRIATYNAYAGALLRDHALRLGRDPEAALLTEAGRWQLAERIVETWPGDLAVEAAPSTVTKAVLELAGSLAEHLLEPADAAAEMLALAEALGEKDPAPGGRSPGAPRAEVAKAIASLRARAALVDLVAEFARRKRDLGVLDFGDQVALACRIAREVPQVAAGERAQYRVVLLDEYQDTSVAQVALLAALYGDGHPVTAVGDPHQAIYGWRGASAGAVERFGVTFPRVAAGDGAREPARTATLSTSWRNDRAILGAANHVAGPLRVWAARDLGSAGDPGSAGGLGETPDRGGVRLPVLTARPGAGAGRVIAAYAEDAATEATLVAEAVAAAWRPTGEEDRPVTAAVLCRARSQMPVIAEALRAAGLPVEVVGLGGLLSTPEIADLHAALLVAHDPSRADAAMRLLTGLRLGIADLAVLHEHARVLARAPSAREDRTAREDEPASIVEAIESPPAPGFRGSAGRAMSEAGRARVTDLGAVLRAIRSQMHLPLPDLVVSAERLLGLDIEVLARPDARRGQGLVLHARRHLDAFAEVAATFAEGSQAPGLGAFLAWLEAAAEYERGLDTVDVEPDPSAVQVLTVHAAKGLEWDVVAVPGLVEGAFPHYDGKPVPTGTPRCGAWLTDLAALPYPARGDALDLPHLDVDSPADHAEMAAECTEFRTRAGAHVLAEERRLAYVALTRARRNLILTGSWWKEDAKAARPPSRFLSELLDAGAVTEVLGDHGVPDAPASVENPLSEQRAPVPWPAARSAERVEALARATAAVEAARTAREGGSTSADAGAAEVSGFSAGGACGLSVTARDWLRDAALLLAEQAGRRGPEPGVTIPAHLSASAVVRLVADPEAFALERRRPVPVAPTPSARRGTQFHAWVERHFGAASLLDVDDLPGADDDVLPVDADLEALQRTFLASRWAGLTPLAVEADLETPVAGTTVRCRVDAVFATGDGVEIVDWKTGRPAMDPADARARQMQLALYRLAWSRLHGVPLGRVDAVFYHVAQDVVVRAEPWTEAQIEAAVAAQSASGEGR